MYNTLLVENPAEHILQITLNRPERMNALNTEMAEEMLDLLKNFDHAQDPDIRVLVFTGAGEKAFCAGADLKERQGMSDTEWRAQHEIFEDMFDTMGLFPIPMVMAIQGVALGGGCEMALTGDLIVAGVNSLFGQPEVKRGIMPGGGGTQRLPRRIGASRAKDMVLTGRHVTAQEAYEWGLANRLVPADYVLKEALVLANTLAENGPIAVRQAKKAIEQGMDVPLEAGLALEIEAYNVCIPTTDRTEGIDAFNEKRPPKFRNR